MRATAIQDARGGSHSLSRALGKALEVVELKECLNSDVVRQRWVLNPRALELRELWALEALKLWWMLGTPRGFQEEGLHRLGALFYGCLKMV